MGCLNSVDTAKRSYNKNALIQVGSRKIVKQTLIAEGAYGSVWKAFQPATDMIFGMKIMRLQSKQLQQMFDKQVAVLTIMKQKNAKNVVRLYQSAKYTFEQCPIGILLLQFSHMNLYQQVHFYQAIFPQINNKHFTKKQIIKILLEIINGLKQLHEEKIYHMDIKPENIILCQGEEYKICDLGSCIQTQIQFEWLEKKEAVRIEEFIQANSTLMYRSPEMIFNNGQVLGEKSDVWMVGLVGYMMLYRKHPFQNQGKTAILSPINFPTQGYFQSILRRMLTIQHQVRISLGQLKQQLTQLYEFQN